MMMSHRVEAVADIIGEEDVVAAEVESEVVVAVDLEDEAEEEAV